MSLTFINPSWFIAQSRIEAMNQAVQPLDAETGTPALPLLTLAFATIALAVAILYFFKHNTARTSNDSLNLFAELCRCNHLSRRQRKLLKGLANYQKVSNPCQIFLDIELWTIAPERPLPQLSTAGVQAELHRLRSLLFTQGKTTPVPAIDSYL